MTRFFPSLWATMACIILTVFGMTPGVAAQFTDPNPPTIHSNQGAWKITRQWTPAETKHYAKWVEHIYKMKTEGTVEQRTAKLPRILSDPEMNLLEQPAFRGEGSNPQLPKNVIMMMHSMVDCAKLTAFMPAYYAYRRGLPWMSAYVYSPGGGDVRTAKANVPSGSASNFTTPSLYAFFKNAVGGFSSGNYRVNLEGKNAQLSDTLPVAIDQDHLLPGCVSYVDGHCLMVGDVTEYGELRFINASTTRTRTIFTYNGMNAVTVQVPQGSGPENGWEGAYQGLRVFRYPIAETNSNGRVINVRRRTNEEMKEFGFSTGQYEGLLELVNKHFIETGGLRPQSMHDFIRLRMMSVDRIAPLAFMEDYVDELLEVYRLREEFVQDAWQDYKENGPIVYPEDQENSNIFQAHGRWETWSSPSSDVDRRTKYFYLAEWMDFVIRCYGVKPSFVDLSGLESYAIESQSDLAAALLREKQRLFAEHELFYTNSVGEKVRLTLAEIEDRLYGLSFDPNHPPELRWGAPEGSEERATAVQTQTPVPSGERVPMEEGYELQAYYRTLGQRETEPSYLRDMFTEGYPVRDKLDTYIARWIEPELQKEILQAMKDNPEAEAEAASESKVSSQLETSGFEVLTPRHHEMGTSR